MTQTHNESTLFKHKEKINQLTREMRQANNLSPKQYRHKFAEMMYYQNKLKQLTA